LLLRGRCFRRHYTYVQGSALRQKHETAMENRTARLTLLVDPNKKREFERLCALEDVTPSQKIRQFMRDYLEQKLGPDWREEVFMDKTQK